MSESKFTGSCLCGGVQYEFTGKPSYMINCHCTMCRRVIGASFGTFIRIPAANLTMVKKGTLKGYKSSEDVERNFCSNCGANIMDKVISVPDSAFLTAATIKEDIGNPVTADIFTTYKAPWITIDDKAKSCGEMELLLELCKTH